MTREFPPLLVLGAGPTGRALVRAAVVTGRRTLATTRDPARLAALATLGAEAVALSSPPRAAEVLGAVPPGTDVAVTFPPDGETDAVLAAALGKHAGAIVYVSSTAVFGEVSGRIDDDTPVAPPSARDARIARRIDAEEAWRAAGATVLRAPAIYGPENGLHRRLRAGEHRITEDGARRVSRIHVEDLATLILAALKRARTAGPSTYVVGDHAPAPQREVVHWLCVRMGLPLPPSVPASAAAPTLRADRAVDSSRALRELGVALRYPTYREGFAQILATERSAP
jgi:nucleoside-diphosphate-sugar epimerase